MTQNGMSGRGRTTPKMKPKLTQNDPEWHVRKPKMTQNDSNDPKWHVWTWPKRPTMKSKMKPKITQNYLNW